MRVAGWRPCVLAFGLATSCAASATVDPFGAGAPPGTTPTPAPVAPPPVAEQEPASARTVDAPAPASAPAEPATPPVQAAPAEPVAAGERRDCSLGLEAGPLLREAASRGIQPRVASGSACDMNPADNEFFGRGGAVACRLHFSNARWLEPGTRFTGITGVGNYEARATPTGLEVSIPADGGVRFRRVTVQTSVPRPTPCPAPRPENVLAD